MLKWVDHVVIAVNDLQKAVEDYEAKLGLTAEIANKESLNCDFDRRYFDYVRMVGI